MIILGVLVGLFVLMSLVLAHEYGHFRAARKNGVKVNEFGIGFPPRAIGWIKDKKTGKWKRLPKEEWQKPQDSLILSVNWLPIGGFCAMDGESDADTKPHTFGAATFWQKTKILFGGVAMNWLVAILILTVLAWTGMPHMLDNQFYLENDISISPQPVVVKEVFADSPAEESGLKSGDIISSVATCDTNECSASMLDQLDPVTGHSAYAFPSDKATEIKSSSDLISFNQSHAGEEVLYQIQRDNQTGVFPVSLNDKDSEYTLGVSMSQAGQTLYRSTWSAPIVGIVTTAQITGETFRGLGQMVGNLFSGVIRQFSSDETTREQGRQDIGTVGDSVSGPVGIIGTLFPAFTEAGPTNVAFLAAIISISLACMNVLPIPALDGGRWFLIALFRLRKKPLTSETEGKIVSRAFIFLIALILIVTVLDVLRLFK